MRVPIHALTPLGRPHVHPAPHSYPLPGTKETFDRFGAVPASARALFRCLNAGEAVLLFPGGAREVFKRKGEAYTLFWPDEPDLVRLAARCGATIVPFSGIGGDDSFTVALDSDELLRAPAVGDFFRERISALPSLVKDDVFVPPVGAITPARHCTALRIHPSAPGSHTRLSYVHMMPAFPRARFP